MAYVRAAMIKVAAKWQSVGLSLRVDPAKTEAYDAKYQGDCYRCLTAVIHDWLVDRYVYSKQLHVVKINDNVLFILPNMH